MDRNTNGSIETLNVYSLAGLVGNTARKPSLVKLVLLAAKFLQIGDIGVTPPFYERPEYRNLLRPYLSMVLHRQTADGSWP